MKGLEFTLRNCTSDDYRFVYGLIRKNMYDLYVKHWGKWQAKVIREGIDARKIKIVEVDGKRVGFYSFEIRKESSHINDLQIVENMQGRGLGTCLVGLMEKESLRKKRDKIRLRVFTDNPAKKLYVKLGFKVFIDEEDSVVLEKKV